MLIRNEIVYIHILIWLQINCIKKFALHSTGKRTEGLLLNLLVATKTAPDVEEKAVLNTLTVMEMNLERNNAVERESWSKEIFVNLKIKQRHAKSNSRKMTFSNILTTTIKSMFQKNIGEFWRNFQWKRRLSVMFFLQLLFSLEFNERKLWIIMKFCCWSINYCR